MLAFSNDVNILRYEAVLFSDLHFGWQVLCEGEGGIESYNAAWIAGRAIDVGWFTAATYVEGS